MHDMCVRPSAYLYWYCKKARLDLCLFCVFDIMSLVHSLVEAGRSVLEVEERSWLDVRLRTHYRVAPIVRHLGDMCVSK